MAAPTTAKTSMKRSSAAIVEHDPERPVKRRAKKACHSCRSRKVRCDIVFNEISCTNCRLDSIECTVPAARKSRNDTNKKRTVANQLDSTKKSSPKACHETASTKAGTGSQIRDETSYLSPKSEVSDVVIPVCLTFDEEELNTSSNVEEVYSDQQSSRFDQSPITASPSVIPSIRSPSAAIFLPAFIKPLPNTLDAQDVEYLRNKGAFELPSQDLLAEVLQAYMLGIHVFMPILSMRGILEAVAKNDGQQSISLLLFQAIIFAGMAHISDDCVQRLGYGSPKEARKDYFTRVRLLYNHEIEQDDTATLQSLLLMSFMYEKQNKRQHTWYWTGLALSHAQSMGLNRRSSSASLSIDSQAAHKRLWWGLYIRDRLIGLGLRRPMRIHDSDFEVSPLAVSDFDTSSFKVVFVTSAGTVTIQQEPAVAELLALLCIELSKLCICIGNILSTQYTVLAKRTELTRSTMLAPKSFEQRQPSLAGCCAELRNWYEVLHPKLRPFALYRGSGISMECSEIHWPILHMIYRTAIIVLHRPNMLQSQSVHAQHLQEQNLSREKVKAAARTLTTIVQTIYQQGHVRLLPTSGVSALLATSLAHLSTVKSSDDDAKAASIFRFCQSIQVLQQLQKIYDSADSAMEFLSITVRKSGLDLQAPLEQLQGEATMFVPMMGQAGNGTALQSQSLVNVQSQGGCHMQILPDHRPAMFDRPTSGVSRSTHNHEFQLQRLEETTLQDEHQNILSYINPGSSTIPSEELVNETQSADLLDSIHRTGLDTLPSWIDDNDFLNVNDISIPDMAASMDLTFDYDADTFAMWDSSGPDLETARLNQSRI